MIKFLFSLVTAFLVVAFFAQNSLVFYANSRFGTNFGLEEFLANSALKFGGDLQLEFNNKIKNFTLTAKNKISELSNFNIKSTTQNLQIKTPAPIIAPSTKDKIIEEELKKIEAMVLKDKTLPKIDENQTTLPKPAETNTTKISKPQILPKSPSDKIHLKTGETVLFIGDSLMQYVSMNAKKLFPQQNLKVVDLSKQSTGLIDKKGHNWQQVLDETLKADANIKLVAVFMGANDTHPRKINGTVRQVGSEQWNEFYSSRVKEIYQVAQKYGTKVLWLGLPCMEEAKFQNKTEAINAVYKSVNKEFNQFFMSTTPLVCENGAYKIYIKNGKKQLRVRQDDGIHISKKGCEILAQKMLSRISVE